MTVSISVKLEDDLSRELDQEVAGGGTVDLSRIRFADPAAFGGRLARLSPAFMAQVDSGLRRLRGL